MSGWLITNNGALLGERIAKGKLWLRPSDSEDNGDGQTLGDDTVSIIARDENGSKTAILHRVERANVAAVLEKICTWLDAADGTNLVLGLEKPSEGEGAA